MIRSAFRLAVGLALAVVTFTLACDGGGDDDAAAATRLSWQEAVARNNRGVALMDRGAVAEATALYRELARLLPAAPEPRVNLAIALLNTVDNTGKGRDEDYRESERLLREVMAEHPDNPWAPYTLGVLLSHLGRDPAEIIAAYEHARRLRPEDAEIAYRLGKAYGETVPPDLDRALPLLREAVRKQPHFQSAWHNLRQTLRRARVDGADEALRTFRRYEESWPQVGKKLSLVYNAMGEYASMMREIAPFGDAPAPAAPSPPPRFGALVSVRAAEPVALPYGRVLEPGGDVRAFLENEVGPALGGGVAVHDVDGDGVLEIWVGDGRSAGRLFERTGPGAWRERDGALPQIATRGIGAVFGDVDHDGDPDLYVFGAGPNQLLLNEGGRFVPVAGVDGGDALTLAASFVDADHDGDLDLVVANLVAMPAAGAIAERAMTFPDDFPPARNHLYNNDRPTIYESERELRGFTDIGERTLVADAARRTAALVALDCDRDGDVDLFECNHGEPDRLLLNDRVWTYRATAPGVGAGSTPDAVADSGPALGAFALDADQDGFPDLIRLRGPDAAAVLELGRHGDGFSARTGFVAGEAEGAILCSADLDDDGRPDLLEIDPATGAVAMHLRDGDGWRAATGDGTAFSAPGARGVVVADLAGDGRRHVVVAATGGGLALVPLTSPAGASHLTLALRGKRVDANAPMWSNSFGLGAFVETAAAPRRTFSDLRSDAGFLAGADPRLRIGLGGADRADYVRVLWPDFVLQNELDLEAGDEPREYVEVNRKASSCPVLFKRCGPGADDFAFVTDFLGVGGLGFFLAPGTFAPADPTELVRVGELPVHDGRLSLRVVEPMEEICYVDELRLVAVAHPADVTVHADERLAVSGAPPSGRPIAFAQAFAPVAATTRRGSDALPALLAVDRRYQPDVFPDRRFVGYLAEEQRVELRFDGAAILAARPTPASPLLLVLDGWVEYPYSHVNFAGWQTELKAESISLDVRDADGAWRTIISDVGYPAGMSRTMTLDVGPLLAAGLDEIRLRTDLEIHVDRLRLAWGVPEDAVRVQELEFDVAELRICGYPREYTPDGALPTIYDYRRRTPTFDWKTMGGRYTRLGDVRALLARPDDRYVVMNHGEEIALELEAERLEPLPAGWTRTYFLKADGWCKDMDPYTAAPDTVTPLPFHGMSAYPPPAGEAPSLPFESWLPHWNDRTIAPTFANPPR